MLIGIRDTGLNTCELTAVDHNSTSLPLPISSDDVRGSLEAMLMDPAMDRVESGAVEFVRHPEAIAISCKAGAFLIHWRYLYWLVQRP